MDAINLEEKFGQFDDLWTPKVLAEVNDCHVKVAKIEGSFVWHHHENEDELFYVVKGRLRLKFRDREVVLEPGELSVVPRGVEHLPIADEETWIVMIEPKGTLNTGNVQNERTVAKPQRI